LSASQGGRRRTKPNAKQAASLLVLARRDPGALAGFDVRIWLREHVLGPEWAVWLARVQQVTRGEPQLGFWVGAQAPPGTYIVDFDARRDPPGFRGIWRVLEDAPTPLCSDGAILLARRALTIDGRRLGSNQAWRRAAAAARAATKGSGSWDLQTFAERFLQRQ
jgi:hypothetical protein